MLRLGQISRFSAVKCGAEKLSYSKSVPQQFSTMKDLLESFDKKPSSNNTNRKGGNNSNSNDGKKKDVLKFSQVMSGSNKFTVNESSAASSSAPIVGVSLRDSFRRVEQQNKTTKDSRPMNDYRTNNGVRSQDMSKKKLADDISKDILQTVTANTLGKYSSAIPEVEEKEVTPGDLRFKQLQQKMHHKKKKLDEKYPTNTSGATAGNPNNFHNNTANNHQGNYQQHQSQQARRPQSPTPAHHQNNHHHNHNNNNNHNGQQNRPVQHHHNQQQNHHGHHSNNNHHRGHQIHHSQRPAAPKPPVDPAPVESPSADEQSHDAKAPQILDIKDYIKEYKQKIMEKKTTSTNNSSSGYSKYSSSANKNSNREKIPPAPKLATTIIKEVTIPSDGLALRELSSKLSLKLSDVKAKLMEVGELEDCDHDDGKKIDPDVIELLVLELGFAPKRVNEKFKAMAQSVKMADLMPSLKNGNENDINVVKRFPTVCVMGHVDHGKTTLLDALRKAKDQGKVAGSEAGGITQKLSAFTVDVREEEKVVFLDTPGHAAFSAMRGQGAMATDIAVLVVALDDGVQPQTIEALKCAQNAKCSIVVALNKADKYPNETERARARSRVLAQLAQHELLTEEYGGDVQVVEVAGKTGEGIDTLVESLLVQAEVMELKACASGQAEAVVLDAHMEKGRGIVADVLVKWGALTVGDPVVVGCSFGRIKSMIDDKGKTIKKALPSQPVRLLGLRSIPNTGAELLSVNNEAKAKQIAERRIRLAELRQAREQSVASEQLKVEEEIIDGEVVVKPVLPSIGVLIKADGLGSLDALKNIVGNIAKCTNEVQIKVLGESVGDVTLSDVERASAVGEALVLGFNVGIADNNTKMTAKQLDVTICKDEVIYRLEDELVQAVESLLPKDRVVTKEGSAKVLKVFKLKDRKNTVVAGLQVHSGKLKSGGSSHKYAYKVIRQGQVLLEENAGGVDLKRFKDSVNEVDSGNECGLSLEGFTDFQEGDEIECYQIAMQQRSLALNGYVSSRISNTNTKTSGGDYVHDASNSPKKAQKSKL